MPGQPLSNKSSENHSKDYFSLLGGHQHPSARQSGSRASIGFLINGSIQPYNNEPRSDPSPVMVSQNDRQTTMHIPSRPSSQLPDRSIARLAGLNGVNQIDSASQPKSCSTRLTSSGKFPPINTHRATMSFSSLAESNDENMWDRGHRREHSHSTYVTSVLSRRGSGSQDHENAPVGHSHQEGLVHAPSHELPGLYPDRNTGRLRLTEVEEQFRGLQIKSPADPSSNCRRFVIPNPGFPGSNKTSSLRPLAVDFIPMSRPPAMKLAQGSSSASHFQPPAEMNRPTFYNSTNYKGNPRLPGNQSADIPEAKSCALWITNLNLQPELEYKQLLSAIHDCGKVYACYVNPPDPQSGHSSYAAKLVFFDARGARELHSRAARGEFVVNEYVPVVRYNRIRTASQPQGPECRVLHIEGPSDIISQKDLDWLFTGNFQFEVENVRVLNEEHGRRRLEWRFGSYRCQAASAKKLIEERRRSARLDPESPLGNWAQVYVYYGVDPCAPDMRSDKPSLSFD
ncbi:hypothetical protein PFICI_13839 [Pestalotiopsis fici W106-1]|uniref:RRM domain-containing protein n=1 Tax=Pestalotiopsis fici (strain W106-1 / CGMCC3.15140) TaxID=1229662 RepID=W3WJB7_PESFW|nr:uncharacterized protein PFICI_13839 [Pestalotiopsis fici W106-1]ETS73973.1 hypothetical protein PFICI_13839 [Pestalotiopsis fici W106-1]